MATIQSSIRPIGPAPRQASARANLLVIVAVTLVFGSALFSVNNVLLDAALASWNKIVLIHGSFNPSLDAQTLYNSAVPTKALDQTGAGLPALVGNDKIKQYDGRIIQQAAQEHRLALPSGFFKGLPGS